jgi:hypothetical protein
MAASAKFLIPFSLLVSLGSHLPWPGHAVAPKSTAYVAIEEMSQPFVEVTGLNTPIAIPVAQPTALRVLTRILPRMLAAIWLSGFITMMSFWCLQWWRISRLVRSAVDKTGLEGRWDFTMKWTPDETQFADVLEPVRRPADEANEPPPLFTAIQQQLGLTLEAQKADVPVLVIDHVDHRSPNQSGRSG